MPGRLGGLLYPTLVPGRWADPGRDKSSTLAPFNSLQTKKTTALTFITLLLEENEMLKVSIKPINKQLIEECIDWLIKLPMSSRQCFALSVMEAVSLMDSLSRAQSSIIAMEQQGSSSLAGASSRISSCGISFLTADL